MRILWFFFITLLIVCGKSESFEEINDSDIKRETSTSDENQKEVENNLTTNPDYTFTRRKRSLDGEDRIKKQQKFHSWGGKRNYDKDEEDKDEEVDEMGRFQYDGARRESIDLINETFPKIVSKEVNNNLLYDNSPQEDKRDPEITNDMRKRSHLYDSILQQVGFYPDLSEQSSKRYPAFNSWAGKRSAAFNSWGGKRAAPFNNWGGKRKAAFNSWGGKRDAAFNSWGGKRAASFNSWGGKRAAPFNSWGGKRSSERNSKGQKGSASFNSWGGKRSAAFNSWGGKRAAPFNSWGGKRTAAFNSWGGKRDSEDINNWQKGQSPVNQDGVEQIKDFDKTRNYEDYLTNKENYDAAETTENNENKEKRDRAFNSWAGKRIVSLNSPGGKKSAAFNSWGGKRSSTSFNSWGGKRDGLLNSLADQKTSAISTNDLETTDNEKDQNIHVISYDSAENVSPEIDTNGFLTNIISHWNRNKPNSGVFDSALNKVNELLAPGNEHASYNKEVENNLRSGQRRFYLTEEEIKKRSGPAFSSWAGKRAPVFTPWYSNKPQSLLISSGKRRPAFSSWGGKRSQLQPLQDADCSSSNINECQDISLIQSDEKKLDGASREKRDVTCSSDQEISNRDRSCVVFRNKRFDKDSKKNRVMTRMLFQGGLSRPMEIKSMSRGLDFYAWGGKRSL